MTNSELSKQLEASIGNGTEEGTLPAGYPTVYQKYTSYRWRLCYMVTLSYILNQTYSSCMGFALVCMTGETGSMPSMNQTDVYTGSSSRNTTSSYLEDPDSGRFVELGELRYSVENEGLLISASFYAGIVSPPIGSMASRKYGPKMVCFVGMCISSLMMLVTPIAARTSLYLEMTCRIIMGLFLSSIMPASMDFWIHWAPLQENAQIFSCCLAGFNIAIVVTFALSGYLCVIPIDHGWPFIFYVFGACGIVWCVVWWRTIYEAPEKHPDVTQNELRYVTRNRIHQDKDSTDRKVPWKKMILSKGVCAYLCISFVHSWTYVFLFGFLPLYMATVLDFKVEENGTLSALPYVIQVASTVLWNYLRMKLELVMSKTNTRKVMLITGYITAAGLFVALAHVPGDQQYTAVAIFTIVAPFMVLAACSALVTPVDMAPQYASSIISTGTCSAYLAMALSPLVMSKILGERSKEKWPEVFYINAGIYVFGSLLFLVLGSGDLQPWADNSQLSIEIRPHPTKKGEENAAYVPDKSEISHM